MRNPASSVCSGGGMWRFRAEVKNRRNRRNRKNRGLPGSQGSLTIRLLESPLRFGRVGGWTTKSARPVAIRRAVLSRGLLAQRRPRPHRTPPGSPSDRLYRPIQFSGPATTNSSQESNRRSSTHDFPITANHLYLLFNPVCFFEKIARATAPPLGCYVMDP